MAIRTKINLELTYFIDWYDSEKKTQQERVDLNSDFMIFSEKI